MADTKFIPVSPNLNLDDIVAQFKQNFEMQGYEVSVLKTNSNVSIQVEHGNRGFKKYMGLAAAITVNISLNGDNLILNFTDSEWLGKIVAFCIGWFLLWIPFITAIIGTVKQVDLPKKIQKDIQNIVMISSNPQ